MGQQTIFIVKPYIVKNILYFLKIGQKPLFLQVTWCTVEHPLLNVDLGPLFPLNEGGTW